MKTPLVGRFSLGILFCLVFAFLLLGGGWLVPLHFLPWVSWHSELPAFLAMAILAWLGVYRLRSLDGQGTLPLPGVALLFVGLALIAVIQACTGLIGFSGDALVLTMYMALCIMGLMLGFAAKGNGSRWMPLTISGEGRFLLTALALTVLIASVISALVAYVQVLDVWDSVSWINRMPQLRRPGGNLGQPNQLATLLLMGMGSLVFLYESGKLGRLLGLLIVLVLGVGLALTESRTGVLSYVLLSAWWWVGRSRMDFKLSAWVVGLVGVGILILFWAWPWMAAMIQGMGTGPDMQLNTKAGTRLIVWPQLLEALAISPWWGWGLGGVSKAHNAVVHAHSVSEPFSYSHNIMLDLALGVGLPLASVLVVCVSVWLWRRVCGAKTLTPWYCLAVVLPVAVHSLLEFPFAYAYFLVPVMLLLGWLEAASGVKPVCHVGVRPMGVLLLLVSMVGFWSVVEYLRIEEDFRIARFEALRIGQKPADYERPAVHLLTQLGALLDGARTVPRPDMTASELALVREVALRYPWTATQNRYALSLALNGQSAEAMRQLRVMHALHGDKNYAEIKRNWETLAQEKYPQLRTLTLP